MHTDCQALVYMKSKKTTNAQTRWYFIQEFDFSVQHYPGTKMEHIDAQNRALVSEAEDTLSTLSKNNLEVFNII